MFFQRVFIAQGNGVTIEYIVKKGSACVEMFRNASYLVATFFGNPDRNCRSKEVAFRQDLRVLVEYLEHQDVHKGFVNGRTLSSDRKNQAALADILVQGVGCMAGRQVQ